MKQQWNLLSYSEQNEFTRKAMLPEFEVTGHFFEPMRKIGDAMMVVEAMRQKRFSMNVGAQINQTNESDQYHIVCATGYGTVFGRECPASRVPETICVMALVALKLIEE